LSKSICRDSLRPGGFRNLEAKLKIHPCIALCAWLAATTAAKADCLAEIKAIMDNHLKAGPYHAVMESSFGGTARTTEVDVILPSSFHMKSAGMESIMLKSGMWMKMNGKWTSMPGGMGAMMAENIKQGMDSGLKGLSNAQCLGPQPIEGVNLSKYEMDVSGEAMGVKATSHITMYASAQGLPQIMQVDGVAMGKKSHMIQHITYDPAIKIEPPAK
jgi:hypothetical protein